MTLVEIMVVVAIIGLLTSAVAVAVVKQYIDAQVKKARVDIATYDQALAHFFVKTGRYPDPGAGLQALVQKGVLDRLRKDPWGNDYRYGVRDGKPVVMSLGSDGEAGGEGAAADLSSGDE